MTKPVDPGALLNPSVSERRQTRFSDWEQSRGFHQGPRSCVPHIEAGHMTAPDRGAITPQSPCIEGAVHTWRVPGAQARRSRAGCRVNEGESCPIGAAAADGGVRAKRSDGNTGRFRNPAKPEFVKARSSAIL